MSRMVTLNAVKAGMTRLRDKGGANPESLYLLENGYVTAARTMESRPGTVLHATLPPSTKGLCVFKGELWTFCHEPVDMTNANGVKVALVRHPTQPNLGLREIHFAAPFMGYLYVVPEFANGDVFHYWLQTAKRWTANTIVVEGTTWEPTVENGYAYEATRTDQPNPVWRAGVKRVAGDLVEPTVRNGYKYECVETFGDNPASGTTEPTWPTTEGGRVFESTSLPSAPPASGSTPPSDNDLPPDVRDRYGRRGIIGDIGSLIER